MKVSISKKRMLYIFALLFVCLIFTLTCSFTFAYFFNRRGETASYFVGQVKVQMTVSKVGGGEIVGSQAGFPLDQVVPNMPIFEDVSVSLPFEGTRYTARACYLRVKFFFEITGQNGEKLEDLNLPNKDKDGNNITRQDFTDYIDEVLAALATCPIYSTSEYSWKYDINDGCYYLVQTPTSPDDKVAEMDTDELQMFELSEFGTTQAYLTVGSFHYPNVGNFPNIAYKQGLKTKFFKLKLNLMSEAIQSEYLVIKPDGSDNYIPVRHMADVQKLMNENLN